MNQARVSSCEQRPLSSTCHTKRPLLTPLLPSAGGGLQPLGCSLSAPRLSGTEICYQRPLPSALMLQTGAETGACVNRALVKSWGPSFKIKIPLFSHLCVNLTAPGPKEASWDRNMVNSLFRHTNYCSALSGSW